MMRGAVLPSTPTYVLLGLVVAVASLVGGSAAAYATNVRGKRRSRRGLGSEGGLSVDGADVESYGTLVTDPKDIGVRVTSLGVWSPGPVQVERARYTVQLAGEPRPIAEDVTQAEARAALIAAGFDDTTFDITLFSPGAMLAPGAQPVVFALAMPCVRRLARLDVALVLAAGRHRVSRVISALPAQRPTRPVSHAERERG